MFYEWMFIEYPILHIWFKITAILVRSITMQLKEACIWDQNASR